MPIPEIDLIKLKRRANRLDEVARFRGYLVRAQRLSDDVDANTAQARLDELERLCPGITEEFDRAKVRTARMVARFRKS